jgi:hypothetical protein
MILKDKKGQLGLLGFAFWIIMFICIWTFWLGGMLATWGQDNITQNGLTGIEAMFYANLNLWVFFGLLIIIYLGIRMGGGHG